MSELNENAVFERLGIDAARMQRLLRYGSRFEGLSQLWQNRMLSELHEQFNGEEREIFEVLADVWKETALHNGRVRQHEIDNDSSCRIMVLDDFKSGFYGVLKRHWQEIADRVAEICPESCQRAVAEGHQSDEVISDRQAADAALQKIGGRIWETDKRHESDAEGEFGPGIKAGRQGQALRIRKSGSVPDRMKRG